MADADITQSQAVNHSRLLSQVTLVTDNMERTPTGPTKHRQ